MIRDCCVVVTTTNNRKIAELIAQRLIENKLAACVQLDEVESFFYQEGGVKRGQEIRLFIKAPAGNYDLIEEAIKQDHNYQLPQIIKLDITAGSQEYLDWIHRGG
jgi:periplasmic divalent cation tolerance protein